MPGIFTVKELLALLEEVASFALAEAWDNVGLMVGDAAAGVSGILIALDPTVEVLEEAVGLGVNTVITHHPLIFHPLKSVCTDQPMGRFLRKALEKNIAVIGCHTNLDQALGGVNDALADALGLEDTKPLVLNSNADQQTGFGRYGRFPEPLDGPGFLKRIAKTLDLPVVSVAGRLPERIETVAVCGGSGSELTEAAFNMGAQVYITGEIKHSTARWAEARGFCVIDAGHFATENSVVPVLVDRLHKTLANRGQELPVRATVSQKKPFGFYLANGSLLD